MNDSMRAEFEAAYLKQFGRDPIDWNTAVESYTDAHSAGAWWGYRTATPKAYGDGWIAATTWGKKDECNERG